MFTPVWQLGDRPILLQQRFLLEKLLGAGGFGETYRASDTVMNRSVVLKVLNREHQSDKAARQRFEEESKMLAKCQHAGVVTVHDRIKVDDRDVIVMEWIDGLSLESYIPSLVRVWLSEDEALGYINQAGEALIHVHAQGLLHRDINPRNIMRCADGRIKLIDFGLARAFDPDRTVKHTNHRSEGYAPIEQYQELGRFTNALDVYSLAATFYYLLTGQSPINAEYRSLYPLVAPREINAQISPAVNQAIVKGMEFLPDQRPQSIEVFLASLKPPVPIIIPDPVIPQVIPKMPARTEPAVVQQPAVVKPPVKEVVPVQPERLKATPKPAVEPVVKQQPRPQVPKDPPQQKAPVKEPLPRRDRIPVVADQPLISRRSLLYGGLVFVGGAGAIALWPKSNETVVPIAQRGRAKTFTEDLGNGVKLEMVEIPKGEFMMGSPSSEQDRSPDEGPQHRVQVPGFYMGKYEVTQAQYQALMGKNPSHFTGDGRLPVEQVSWLDAMDFCQKLSQKTGRAYRLPSEAEWEYACRAGTTTPFAFGETISAATVNYNGNYPYGNAAKGEYRKKTTPVGSFPANAFGLYDMHGNLWEWCLDEWVDNYNNAPVNGSSRGDIKSRATEKQRLLRGGSWYFYANFCRSANRDHFAVSFRDLNFGFRLLAVAPRTF
jgi:formylglycine-generating enzyme required for sulfatase activity/tRNA A-37 threonylcarbamoyl transferase component Bud32